MSFLTLTDTTASNIRKEFALDLDMEYVIAKKQFRISRENAYMVAMLKCALPKYGGNTQWGDIISIVIFPSFYSSVFLWI